MLFWQVVKIMLSSKFKDVLQNKARGRKVQSCVGHKPWTQEKFQIGIKNKQTNIQTSISLIMQL